MGLHEQVPIGGLFRIPTLSASMRSHLNSEVLLRHRVVAILSHNKPLAVTGLFAGIMSGWIGCRMHCSSFATSEETEASSLFELQSVPWSFVPFSLASCAVAKPGVVIASTTTGIRSSMAPGLASAPTSAPASAPASASASTTMPPSTSTSATPTSDDSHASLIPKYLHRYMHSSSSTEHKVSWESDSHLINAVSWSLRSSTWRRIQSLDRKEYSSLAAAWPMNKETCDDHQHQPDYQPQHQTQQQHEYESMPNSADEKTSYTPNVVRMVAGQVIKKIATGYHVTSISLPIEVQQPMSALEKTTNAMQRGEIIVDVVSAPDATSRMLQVVRFFLSGLPKEPFGKKPLNPLLGEIYRAAFMHKNPEAGCTLLLAEQVSTQPPMTALHIENEAMGFAMTSLACPEPHFRGNTLTISMKGMVDIHLAKQDEHYHVTRPVISMSGLMGIGSPMVYFSGSAMINCEESGLQAQVDFYQKKSKLASLWNSVGLFKSPSASEDHEHFDSTGINGISGCVKDVRTGDVVMRLHGHWDDKVYAVDESTGEQTLLFDLDREQKNCAMTIWVPPESELEDNNSLQVWRKVKDNMLSANWTIAFAHKSHVEEAQRFMLHVLEMEKKEWIPAFFAKVQNSSTRYLGKEGSVAE